MRSVVAKFRCVSRNEHANWSGEPGVIAREVKLQAVSSSDGINKSWNAATPSGQLTMTINNRAAIDNLELGKEYILTLEEATPAVENAVRAKLGMDPLAE